MAKQTFTTGQVLTAAQMTSLQQTAMGGGSATAKTASYTLVAADAGATIIMNSASATTITVNTSLFSAGDTVFIQNIGAGVSTITAGTATVNTASSLALAQYESGNLYFTAAGTSIFSKADGAAASGGGMTLIQEQTASASSSINFTGIAGTYKQLLLIISGLYHSTTGSQFSVRFNNSSVAEYTCSGEGTNGTLAGTYSRIVAPQPFLGEDTTSTTADDTVKASLLIDNYASSTKFKYFEGCTSFNFGGDQFHNVNGFWGNTTAITSVDIVRLSGAATITNLANTSIRLYGIS